MTPESLLLETSLGFYQLFAFVLAVLVIVVAVIAFGLRELVFVHKAKRGGVPLAKQAMALTTTNKLFQHSGASPLAAPGGTPPPPRGSRPATVPSRSPHSSPPNSRQSSPNSSPVIRHSVKSQPVAISKFVLDSEFPGGDSTLDAKSVAKSEKKNGALQKETPVSAHLEAAVGLGMAVGAFYIIRRTIVGK